MNHQPEWKTNMTQFKKTLLLVSLTAILFAFAVQPASATSFTLSTGDAGLSGYTGPYGTVSVSLLNSSAATITFTALSSGGFDYLFGDGGSVALNVTGTGISYAGGTGITQPQVQPNGSTPWQVGGLGNFNFVLANFYGLNNALSTFTFTLTNTSGNWTNAASVLTANNAGQFVAAHIFLAHANGGNTNVTGIATNGVPDGGMTISMLGLALVGMGLVARRKK
jgi:hypothetical protein